MEALHKIGYGLYVVTSNDGSKDNGLIVNTVSQVSNDRIAVSISKSNYSHDIVKNTGVMNINCLTTETPFKVFSHFGFQSGRDTDKFAECAPDRSANGLIYLPRYINAYISLKVETYMDLGSHGMFICEITDSKVLSDLESMTYSYYHANVKPKPQAAKGYICKICGFVYEGAELPADYECPLCKHPASDFEPIM